MEKIALHGGFWRAKYDLTYMGHLCAVLTVRGVATWNVEYRRIGNPSGGWPGTLQDVAQAADYLRMLAHGYSLDLERVVTLGHSAGGQLALWLAGRYRLPASDPLYSPSPLSLRAAIALAGVVDLQRAWELGLSDGVVETFLGGRPDTVPERFASSSPAQLLPLGVQQVLVHGTNDESVPFDLSRRYYTVAAELGDTISLYALPGVRHFEPVDPRCGEWQVVARAVVSMLDRGGRLC
jgi:acetyl esterase/lipase